MQESESIHVIPSGIDYSSIRQIEPIVFWRLIVIYCKVFNVRHFTVS